MASIGQKMFSGRMPSSWSVKCSGILKNMDKKLTKDFFPIPSSHEHPRVYFAPHFIGISIVSACLFIQEWSAFSSGMILMQ